MLTHTPVTAPFTHNRRPQLIDLHTPGRRSLRVPAGAAGCLAGTGIFDLIVDITGEKMTFRGRTIGLEGRTLPVRLLAQLARQPGIGVPEPTLFQVGWGRSFRHEYDANTLQAHVSALRRILRAVSGDEELIEHTVTGYRLVPGLRCAVIESVDRALRRSRRTSPVHIARVCGFVNHRTLRRWTGMSASMARRELARLAAAGELVRIGRGRGTHYRPATGAAVQSA